MIVSTSVARARSFHELDMKLNPFNPKNHLLHWTSPDEGWIKLNTDGAVSDDGTLVGGVLRDANANWL